MQFRQTLLSALALFQVCQAMPTAASNEHGALEAVNNLVTRENAPIEKRQVGAALEMAFSWVIDLLEEAGGEATHQGITGTVTLEEDLSVTAGTGVTVSTSSVTGSVWHLAITKLDQELYLEGHAEVFINRFTGTVTSWTHHDAVFAPGHPLGGSIIEYVSTTARSVSPRK